MGSPKTIDEFIKSWTMWFRNSGLSVEAKKKMALDSLGHSNYSTFEKVKAKTRILKALQS